MVKCFIECVEEKESPDCLVEEADWSDSREAPKKKEVVRDLLEGFMTRIGSRLEEQTDKFGLGPCLEKKFGQILAKKVGFEKETAVPKGEKKTAVFGEKSIWEKDEIDKSGFKKQGDKGGI